MKEIEQERQELDLLIGKGVNIDVEREIFVKQPGLFGYFKKRVKKTEKLRFNIQEPTLSTLDRISSEQIDLSIDEKLMTSEKALCEARKLTKEHSRRLAKIVAIAVLGQDYVIAYQKGNNTVYSYDNSKLNELTDIFFNSVKPSMLLQYALAINSISNLGDFTNSIRLMSANRTTMPILIEQKD